MKRVSNCLFVASYINRKLNCRSVSKFLVKMLLLLLDEDEDLDKFGQALDSGQDLSAVDTSSKTDSKSASDQVQWEFKWENATAAALYGPFGTQQMADWKEQG